MGDRPAWHRSHALEWIGEHVVAYAYRWNRIVRADVRGGRWITLKVTHRIVAIRENESSRK